MGDKDFDIELQLLLQALYLKYHYDFRAYAVASLKRRLRSALPRLGCTTLSQVQERLIHDPATLPELLDVLTVPVSEMFRDPPYFRAVRQHVVPVLRTYPSIRVWVAGCSTGEEVYGLAILLREEGLLDRALLYATDINPTSLRAAEAGIYDIDRVAGFTANHQQSGGTTSLSEHYTAAYGHVAFDRRLRDRMVFSDHSLATDSVFAEVHLVSCRNVLIYFTPTLQERAIGLFRDSLVRRGFLGLGGKETLRFTTHAEAFEAVVPEQRLYRRSERA